MTEENSMRVMTEENSMRVAVIGSPVVPQPRLVRQALNECLRAARRQGTALSVIVGGNRTGAEQIAARWVGERRRRDPDAVSPLWTVSPRWADPCRQTCKPGHRRAKPGLSDTACPSAPMYRNQELVKMDIDLFLVFIHNGFPAAKNMLDLCKRHGKDAQPFRSP